MKVSTRLWIGGALLAVGLGVAGLGLLAGQSDVRQVADVVAAPAAHTHGHYTLLGVPEPPLVPVTSATGMQLERNDQAPDETVYVTAWDAGGQTYHSTHRLRATSNETSHATHFWFRNETRLAGHNELALPLIQSSWDLPGTAFAVRGFQSGAVEPPQVWALYEGPFKDPLQPKPSQFVGQLMANLPTTTATPLPDGALVYHVESYTAGCSSKFIPPEEKNRLGAEYNGTV